MDNIISSLVSTSTATEEPTVSSSKLWFNIANTVVTLSYIAMAYAIYKMPTPAITDFTWLTLVYSGIVTTNKFANKFLDYKYTKEVK